MGKVVESSPAPEMNVHKITIVECIEGILQNMRQFFDYCYLNGLSKDNKSSLIPKFYTPHVYHLPPIMSIENVKCLLESIDRANTKGKRDYAILLLAARLGIRAIDIANLQLNDLNWSTNEIILKQEKTYHTKIARSLLCIWFCSGKSRSCMTKLTICR